MLRKCALVLVFCLVASFAYSGQDKIIIKWGDTQGPTHIAMQMVVRIGDMLKEKTNGRIEVQAYPASQMGTGLEMLEGVSMGMLEMMTEGCAIIGQFVPSIGIAESPYVFRDPEHLIKVMDGEIGQEINKQLIEKFNMRMLGTTYYGMRHLTSTSKEIRGVKDMEGFKLRVPESEVFLKMVEAWGGRATPMNFSELYLALKQNVVDGQENPLPTIEAAKLYEVQKYLVLTGHIITPRMALINEELWQRLSPEDQKLLQECVSEGIAWNNREIRKRELELVEELGKMGMTVVEVDIEEFRKPVIEKLVPAIEPKWGKGVWERIQAVK